MMFTRGFETFTTLSGGVFKFCPYLANPTNRNAKHASTLIKMASTAVTSTSFCPVPHAFRDQVIDHISPCRDATGPLSSLFAHIIQLHIASR